MLKSVIQGLRESFSSGLTRTLQARLEVLEKFESSLADFEPILSEALYKDLGKSAAEAFNTELGIVKYELAFARKKLKHWMKVQTVRTPLYLWPARSELHVEPRGVVLIIGAWNYPVQLILAPLVGALAAGNVAILKPSEIATHTSLALKKFVQATFSTDWVQLVEGGVAVTTDLLKENFDLIFFTGSTSVGRIIYEAAAKKLTPVVLELGGKSPAIVCEDADLELSARRLVWGKFMNAGQTCVAPDYLYVQSSIQENFLVYLKKALTEFYGVDAQLSPDFGRIINDSNFDRLMGLTKDAQVIFGGRSDKEQLFIEPTLLSGVTWDSPVMKEEIFGPLLPILSFEKSSDLFHLILQKEKPLAAYLFTTSQSVMAEFYKTVSFGGACVNDTVLQFANHHLPFGGVGSSGMGAYHGEKSFQTFSHAKGVLRKARFLDISLRYPPFTPTKIQWLKKIVRFSRWLE